MLRWVHYTMCMHINTGTMVSLIEQMSAEQLDQLQQAINRRRQQLADGPLSTVVERPYWYFHFREGGKQRTKYLGKTDDPEAKVDEIMTKGEESR
jgi:hypothetical protein